MENISEDLVELHESLMIIGILMMAEVRPELK
jgi:hypothetical protein